MQENEEFKNRIREYSLIKAYNESADYLSIYKELMDEQFKFSKNFPEYILKKIEIEYRKNID